MNIYYLINLIKKRLWLIIIVPIIGATAAFIILSALPDSYKSTAHLATGFTTDETVKLTDERFNTGKTNQDFDNIIAQMTSESVVMLVSYKLMLHDLKADKPFREVDYTDAEISKPTPEEKEEMIRIYQNKLDSMTLLSSSNPQELLLLEQMKMYRYSPFWLKEDGLLVERINNSDFISVDFTSEDPKLSALVVNTLCQEFIRYNRSVKTSISGESIELLAKLVEEKREDLDHWTKRLNDYKSNNQVINQKAESDITINQISDYETKRAEQQAIVESMRLSILQAQRRLDQATNKNGNNNAKVLELRDRIKQLNQLYIDGNSQDAELEETLNNLRDQLQVEMTKLGTEATLVDEAALRDELNNYELQMSIAKSNLVSINNTLSRLRSQISSHNTKESSLEALTQEVEMATKNYNAALDDYNEYKNKSLVIGSSLRILKKGQPAIQPEPQYAMLITALAGVSSFALCVVFIMLAEFIDYRIKTSDNFRKMTRMKLAGPVNKITTRNLKLSDIFNENNRNKDLIVFKQLLRKVRFELEGSGARTVLVTSTKIGEGKTFLILCLAYSLSMIKKKVLIIDTNFKNNGLTKQLLVKPNFQKLLDSGNKKGRKYLLNNNNGEALPEDDPSSDFTKNIVFPTGHKNIDVIGSHSSTNSPMEILAGKDFKKMLKTFEQHYDYVLMEGASLNEFPDTKELVKYVDVVLPIFSAESTIKQADKESIQYLKSLNGRLAGAILNKVEDENLKI